MKHLSLLALALLLGGCGPEKPTVTQGGRLKLHTGKIRRLDEFTYKGHVIYPRGALSRKALLKKNFAFGRFFFGKCCTKVKSCLHLYYTKQKQHYGNSSTNHRRT